MSKCTCCPFVRTASNCTVEDQKYVDWTVEDQKYVEKIVKLSGVPYFEFMFWLSSVMRKVKVE